MHDRPKSDLLGLVERAVALASRAVARYSSKVSKKRYTLRQHVVLLFGNLPAITTLVHTSSLVSSRRSTKRWNPGFASTRYNRRNMNETVNAAIEQIGTTRRSNFLSVYPEKLM